MKPCQMQVIIDFSFSLDAKGFFFHTHSDRW